MRKLLITRSHDSEIPMPVQCNIISLIGHFQDDITFATVRWRQIKILKKNAWFGVSNSQGTQNTESHLKLFYSNGYLTNNLFWSVVLLEIWSKLLKNTIIGVLFGSFLAVGLDLYSRTNTCAIAFSYFSTGAEQLAFRTFWFYFCSFLVRDLVATIFNLSVVIYNLSCLF